MGHIKDPFVRGKDREMIILVQSARCFETYNFAKTPLIAAQAPLETASTIQTGCFRRYCTMDDLSIMVSFCFAAWLALVVTVLLPLLPVLFLGVVRFRACGIL